MVVETAAALRRVRCVIEKQVLSALCFTIVKTKGIVRLSISGQLTGAGYNGRETADERSGFCAGHADGLLGYSSGALDTAKGWVRCGLDFAGWESVKVKRESCSSRLCM